MNDFIETYPNTLNTNTCQALISFFENSEDKYKSTVGSAGISDDIIRKSTGLSLNPGTNEGLVKIVSKSVQDKYIQYAEKYPILKNYTPRPEHFSINCYEDQTEGYTWHSDGTDVGLRYRFLSAVLYLATVKEGGETEFRYQQRKISPEEGTLLLFPSGWTHEHRGIPPTSGKKYIITSWIRYPDSPLL